MNGNELLKKLKRFARDRHPRLEIISTRGKGSHVTLVLGDRSTTLKDRRKEIGPGLLRSMLRDLGVDHLD